MALVVINFTISRSGLVLNAVLSRKVSKMRPVPAKTEPSSCCRPGRCDRLSMIKKAADADGTIPGDVTEQL